ncbi:MAG TPA: LysM peptidoglycan-binding domain-containing protein, partial [Phenylobacterium sp.]|nr:LysM peptidoglycan-binding domain-containing protein [Phenylobacterium sp.]
MTHLIQRSVLLLLATSALSVVATASGAEDLRPSYPVRLSAAPVSAEPAVLRGSDDSAGRLLFAADQRPQKAAARSGPRATYEVKSGDTLEKIAKTLGTTIPDLKAANGLRKSVIRPGQILKNPKAKAESAPSKGKSRKSRVGQRVAADLDAAPSEPTTYTVRRGDTLFSISQKLHVPLEALRSANRLSKKAAIHAGQTLNLPSDDTAATRADEAPAKGSGNRRAAAPNPDTGSDYAASGRIVSVGGKAVAYKVRKGDTLDKIARKLHTDVAQLRRDNRIKGDVISAGRVLKGPRSSAKAYVAGAGDTLAGIAERFGVSVASLR